MHNQKLATLCQMFETIDKNGSYSELYNEYQQGDITLSQAIGELKETINNMIAEHGTNKQFEDILGYINY